MQAIKKETSNTLSPSHKSKEEQRFDLMAKLIIIGDSGVGKTNILTCFCQNIFKQSHVATIGVDFKTKTMQIEDTRIKMQVWDTAGQERFKTITETYYKGAAGIIIVYSVDCRQSFLNVRKWFEQVNQKVPSSIPKILVANKIDLFQQNAIIREEEFEETLRESQIKTKSDEEIGENEMFEVNAKFFQKNTGTQRQVPKEEGEQLANQLNMCYLEVSARQNTQIYEIFYTIGKQIIKQPESQSNSDDQIYYRKLLIGQKFDHYGDKTVKISEHQKTDSCAC